VAPPANNLDLGPSKALVPQSAILNDFQLSLIHEGKRRVLLLTAIFAITAPLILGVGMLLPKNWDASTTIAVETRNIIEPLMAGRAVTTGVSDQTSVVGEILFSRRILREVSAFGGWLTPKVSRRQEERMLSRLKSSIKIASPREGMIRISFRDTDPERTYKIANKLAEIFVRESTSAKERESREAFDFIANQAKEYSEKLADAHEKVLAYYRGQGRGPDILNEPAVAPDAPKPKSDAPSRGPRISSEELAALRAEEATLTTQLGRKPAPGASDDSRRNEEQARARVQQAQGDLLRLTTTYTDQHPDVKRAQRDLAVAKDELRRAEDARLDREKATQAASALDDEVTQAARLRLAEVQRKLVAATGIPTRRGSATTARAAAVAATEADPEMRGVGQDTTLSELLRRYEATRDVYQDLLKRRENARVSMDLDAEHRGLTARIEEAAEMPVTASSMRLMNLALISLVLGAAIPIGLLVLSVRLDPRVRSARQIQRLSGIPVLVTVPYAPQGRGAARERNRIVLAILMVVGVFLLYIAAFVFKMKTST